MKPLYLVLNFENHDARYRRQGRVLLDGRYEGDGRVLAYTSDRAEADRAFLHTPKGEQELVVMFLFDGVASHELSSRY